MHEDAAGRAIFINEIQRIREKRIVEFIILETNTIFQKLNDNNNVHTFLQF